MLIVCKNTFYFALFIAFNNCFSDGHCDSLIPLALESCVTIPLDVDAIFQLGKLTHVSAYYLLQNLSCI